MNEHRAVSGNTALFTGCMKLLAGYDMDESLTLIFNDEIMDDLNEANIIGARVMSNRNTVICESLRSLDCKDEQFEDNDRLAAEALIFGIAELGHLWALFMKQDVTDDCTQSFFIGLVDDYMNILDDYGQPRQVWANCDIFESGAKEYRAALDKIRGLKIIEGISNEEEGIIVLCMSRISILLLSVPAYGKANNGSFTTRENMIRNILKELSPKINAVVLTVLQQITGNMISNRHGSIKIIDGNIQVEGYEFIDNITLACLDPRYIRNLSESEKYIFDDDKLNQWLFDCQLISQVNDNRCLKYIVDQYDEMVRHGNDPLLDMRPSKDIKDIISCKIDSYKSVNTLNRQLHPHHFGMRGYSRQIDMSTVDGIQVGPERGVDICNTRIRRVDLDIQGYKYQVYKEGGKLKLKSQTKMVKAMRLLRGLTVKGSFMGAGIDAKIMPSFLDITEDMAEEQILDLLMTPQAGPLGFTLAMYTLITERKKVDKSSSSFLAMRYTNDSDGYQLYNHIYPEVILNIDALTDGKHVYLDFGNKKNEKLQLKNKGKNIWETYIKHVNESDLKRCGIYSQLYIT